MPFLLGFNKEIEVPAVLGFELRNTVGVFSSLDGYLPILATEGQLFLAHKRTLIQ